MRSLFKISLAVLALGFLVVAGSVQAQDSGMQKPTLQITGIFSAGFGLVNYDKFQVATSATNTFTDKAYSEWVTSYEHRIRFIYGTDDLTGKLVLRPRGSSSASINACRAAGGSGAWGGATQDAGQGACAGTNSSGAGATNQGIGGTGGIQAPTVGGSAFLADIYGTLAWKPMKELAIEFGRMEGVSALEPIAGTYFMSNPVFSGSEYWMNWSNIDGITVTYNAGILQAGIGISSRCQPRCSTGNYNLVTAAGNLGANGGIPALAPQSGQVGASTQVAQWQSTQTIVPYVNGKVGDLGFRAQLPMTSGEIKYTPVGETSTKARSQSGSGYDIGVSFSGVPGMVIAADVQNFVVTKDTTLCVSTPTNACKDWARDAIVVKFEFQGFQLGYFDQTTDDGKGIKNSKIEDTFIKIHYMIPVGPGVVGPEYTQGTFGKRSLASFTNAAAVDGSYKDITNSVIRLVGRIIF